MSLIDGKDNFINSIMSEPDEDARNEIETIITNLSKIEKRKVTYREGLAFYRILELSSCVGEGFFLDLLWPDDSNLDDRGMVIINKEYKFSIEYISNIETECEIFISECDSQLDVPASGGYSSTSYDTIYTILNSIREVKESPSPGPAYRLGYCTGLLSDILVHENLDWKDANTHRRKMKQVKDGHEGKYGIKDEKIKVALSVYNQGIQDGMNEREAQKLAGKAAGVSDRTVRRYIKEVGQFGSVPK